MTEQRNRTRHKVFKAGLIEFGGSAVDCTVRNISDVGAALEVASPFGIPSEFALLICIDRVQRNCHVVWRKANRLGVQFD